MPPTKIDVEMTEYMDIVDEDDNIIGWDTRKNVHDNYQIHRGIHIFVVNDSGQLLIQKRSTAKDYYPGYYDIAVGGQVSSGETYEESAARELREELGCHDGPLTYVADYDAFSERQREKRRIFEHRCNGPFDIDPSEVDAIEFLSEKEVADAIEERPFTEGFKRSFAIYRSRTRNK
jgi:isopentenyl-diphosphate delta-isomerase